MMDPDDPRIAHLIRPDDGGAADAAILGAPFDGGVVAGGGRAGAAEGPAAVRRALARAGAAYLLEEDLSLEGLSIIDAGDIDPGRDTRETHRRLEAALAALLARDAIPILVGGGHDLTFAALAALARARGAPVGAVNIDAHLDVRPVRDGVITSGTPFRRAIDGEPPFGRFLDARRYVVLGPHGNRNARAHLAWLRDHGGRILPLADARRLGAAAAMQTALAWAMVRSAPALGAGRWALGEEGDSANAEWVAPAFDKRPAPSAQRCVYVSLDIDSAAQAYAPGCSAPGADGFRPDELLAFAFRAGRDPSVAAFDVMEVAPRFDHDDRTAALAAAAIVRFLFGLAARKADHGMV